MDTVGFHRNHSETAGGKATWRLGNVAGISDLTGVAILGASRLRIRQLSDLDVSPAAISDLVDAEDYKQWSLELRASGNGASFFGFGDGIQFVGGLFLFKTNYHFRASLVAGEDLPSYLLTPDAAQLASQGSVPGFPFPIPGGVLEPGAVLIGDDRYHFDFVQDTTTIAPFGQVTIDWRSWSLVPGIRFNWESKEADTLGEGQCASKAVTGTCVMESILSANDYAAYGLERSEFDVSPKVSLLYHWTDDVTAYATWARGYKSGGFKSISFTGEELEFDPEKSSTYELGAKTRFLDDTLQLNLALFRTEFDDLQVLGFNGVFLDVENAASATSQGLELDGSWLTPWEPLSVTGSVGLLHARYDSYPDAPAPVTQGINETQDLGGEEIAFAPDRMITLSPTLTFPVWREWPLVFGLDVLHVGPQFTDYDLDRNTRVTEHTTFALRTSLSGATGFWTVMVGAKNVTDERYLNQVTDTPFFPGTYAAQQPAARVLFGGVRLKW
jgi:iron complex outermembrane recepter protein